MMILYHSFIVVTNIGLNNIHLWRTCFFLGGVSS